MIVILHNIRSLQNVGSIFRTADAAGAEKIYLCGITPKPIDELGRQRDQLTKVSLGAEKYIPWEHIKSTSSLIRRLKKDKYKVFAIEQSKNSIPYNKSNAKGQMSKVVLVVGNEVKGLPKSILNKADKILEIPMFGKKESLNVAVAFGVVVFELIK